MLNIALFATTTVVSLLGANYVGIFTTKPFRTWRANDDPRWNCHPFLPPLLVQQPPSAAHPKILEATRDLYHRLSERFEELEIDSLSVAVVTSAGPIFEHNWGILRANESVSEPVTSHSIYRIASVSKLFAALEGWVLQQKGRMSW